MGKIGPITQLMHSGYIYTESMYIRIVGMNMSRGGGVTSSYHIVLQEYMQYRAWMHLNNMIHLCVPHACIAIINENGVGEDLSLDTFFIIKDLFGGVTLTPYQ